MAANNKCPFCTEPCGNKWCSYNEKGMEKKDHFLEITKTEAFEIGRVEGLKEAFREMLDLSATEIKFFKVYIKARLKSIEENVINIEKFKRGLK